MIILGWGRRTVKRDGPVVHQLCANCKNTGWWQLVTVRVWFTLFFIPVFPYRTRHLLLCPTCMRGVDLTTDGLARARAVNAAAARLHAGVITPDEYWEHVRAAGYSSAPGSAAEAPRELGGEADAAISMAGGEAPPPAPAFPVTAAKPPSS